MRRKTVVILAIIIICTIVAGVAYKYLTPAEPIELTVYKADDSRTSTIVQISKEYSDEHNTKIEVLSIKGRKGLLKDIIENEGEGDVVILEIEYPLFNLLGMETLKDKGFIEKYRYLYSREVLMVVRKGEGIKSIEYLGGKRVAVVDYEEHHVPGACLAPKIIEDSELEVTEVKTSSIEGLLEAIVEDRADATFIWDGQFINSYSDEVETVELPQYKMDNAIAILNKSENSEDAEHYVNYLLDHKAIFLP